MFQGAIRGLGLQSKAFWANSLNYIIGLPLSLFFGFIYIPFNGLTGLWIGFYIAQLVIGVYFGFLLKRVEWVAIKEINDSAATKDFIELTRISINDNLLSK